MSIKHWIPSNPVFDQAISSTPERSEPDLSGDSGPSAENCPSQPGLSYVVDQGDEPGPSNQPCQSFEPTSTSPSGLNKKEKLAKVLSPGTNGENVPSPLKNNLPWPGTPTKTKSKRKTSEKLPAVISSEVYQRIERDKRERKKKADEIKEERKRLRELKRNEKLNSSSQKSKPKTQTKNANTTSKKKLIFDDEEDWICKMCHNRFSSELIRNIRRRWIECDMCKQTFHYKCIPKRHLDSFGVEESDDDEEELHFICHLCTQDCESDADPFVLESDSDFE